MKKNNINGVYDKKKLDSNDLKDLIFKIKNNEINGLNITVPFKNEIIPYLDELTKSRIKTLKVWLDGIEEGDVCSGSVKIARE